MICCVIQETAYRSCNTHAWSTTQCLGSGKEGNLMKQRSSDTSFAVMQHSDVWYAKMQLQQVVD